MIMPPSIGQHRLGCRQRPQRHLENVLREDSETGQLAGLERAFLVIGELRVRGALS